MTEVAFHFNAPDKLAYACRFARKVHKSGARLAIVAPPEALKALDQMLWNMAAQDFVAHALAPGPEELLTASPVILATGPAAVNHRDVLLNLTAEVPLAFDEFSRVVEVVSSYDEADRHAARQRWKQYVSQGYAITRHDLVLKGS